MILYTLIGIPGSGKSTYAKKLQNENTVIVCPDDIRLEIFGDIMDQSKGDYIFSIAWERINALLNNGKNVIFDATNYSRRYRRAIFQKAPKDTEHIAVVFHPPIEECKKRNKARSRNVPEDVIDKMARRFDYPSKKEGFKKIIDISF